MNTALSPSTSSLFLILLVCCLTLSRTNGFYVYQALNDGLTTNKSENENVIHDFRVEFAASWKPNGSDNSSISFPDEFYINMYELNTAINVTFVRMLANDSSYPISSDAIFVLDAKTGRPKRYESPKVNNTKCGFYYQKNNKNGFATLIPNVNSTEYPFRMLATIFLTNKTNGERFAFDLTPIKNISDSYSNEQKKNANAHRIEKRNVSNSDGSKNESPLRDIPDYIISTSGDKNDTHTGDGRRKRRSMLSEDDQGPVMAYVEHLVVCDVTIFNEHSRFVQTNDKDVVFENMRIYFAHVINGVNQRYENSFGTDPDLRIYVKLKNYLFLTEPVEWTDQTVVGDPATPSYMNQPVLIASPTYTSFIKFMKNVSLSFGYDHASGWFKKDLWSDEKDQAPEVRSKVVGLSAVGEICTSNRYSIIEEFGGFGSVVLSAHELAHNLGAYHDGQAGFTESCPSTDGYIMAPSQGVFDKFINLQFFSNCSKQSIKTNLVYEKELSSRGRCLSNQPIDMPIETTVVNNSLPGLSWSLDDQCKMRHGPNASFCRTQSSLICSLLVCRFTPDTGSCTGSAPAAEGSFCDTGKICLKGECVASPLAPKIAAPLGDDIIARTTTSLGEFMTTPYMTCAEALDMAISLNFSPTYFCQNEFAPRCFQSCLQYNALSCQDKYYACPKVSPFLCSFGYVDGQPMRSMCPRLCHKKCKSKPLSCHNSSFLCENGGTCVNAKVSKYIGFKCECPPGYSGQLCEKKDACVPNPCQSGQQCQHIGSLGYVCTPFQTQ